MTDFLAVTELAGDDVTQEQIDRICHRYYWAASYCQNKDVLEIACGTGQGLGYLAHSAKSIQAGDYSDAMVARVKSHYGDRIPVKQFDAQDMPFEDNSMDVIILFEALYYIPAVEKFINECLRVLRPHGQVLIATANKDLYDFNPSPHSHEYYGIRELHKLFSQAGFSVDFFGNIKVNTVSLRQKVLRPIKKLAVDMGLMPKTMKGKKLLKRLVFGKLKPMPHEITQSTSAYKAPPHISEIKPDTQYKTIYCAATLRDK